MTPHPDLTLFSTPQPLQPRRAALALALTLAALTLNAGAGRAEVSLGAAALAASLLILQALRTQRSTQHAAAWSLSLLTLAGLIASALRPQEALLAAGARLLAGVAWTLWLRTQLDWPALRTLLLHLHAPPMLVTSLDQSIRHGLLTLHEWRQRRDAAQLRSGQPRLRLASWGRILGDGALHAFERLEQVEESTLLRAATSPHNPPQHGLRLQQVAVQRGALTVLHHLDLHVTPGECLLVCGTSGSGKSSLLRLLAGLEPPADGLMTRLGTPLQHRASLRERLDGRVALLGQNPEHHFIASTVAEDIAWGLLQRGLEEHQAQERISEVAEALSIQHLLKRPCHHLSFGEQRRAALAGLLVLQPSLLLLDEPTAGLDPVAARDLTSLIQRYLQSTDAICIWATHDLHNLPSCARRTLLLKDQRILFDGDTPKALSRDLLLQAGLDA